MTWLVLIFRIVVGLECSIIVVIDTATGTEIEFPLTGFPGQAIPGEIIIGRIPGIGILGKNSVGSENPVRNDPFINYCVCYS
jgi:hypothetical protein